MLAINQIYFAYGICFFFFFHGRPNTLLDDLVVFMYGINNLFS